MRVFFDVLYWLQFALQAVGIILETINIMQTAQFESFDDAVQIFKMTPCVGHKLLAMSKSCKAVYYRPVFVNLIKELEELWPRGELQTEEQAVVKKALRQLSQFVKGYFWCNIVLLLLFFGPSLVVVLKNLAGYDGPLVLPLFYWLPFDPFQHPQYEFLLVVQYWIGWTVICFILSGDLLFCVFLNHITMQLDLLSLRIKRLVYVPTDQQLVAQYPLAQYSEEYLQSMEEDVNSYDFKQWESRHMKELNNIIITHRDLIRLAGDVEEMFSFALLVNFFNSSIMICFCGFCIAVVEEWTDPTYKIFVIFCLYQTWMLCWYGQKLTDSSEGVSEALYNSGWYQASKKIKSNIIIMIVRSQRQVYVTTYGFSVVSLQSFTTIMKTSWSYFTLLLNIYNK